MNTEYNKQEEQIIQMLTPQVEVKPSADLKDRILQAAATQQAEQATEKPRRSRLSYWIGAATSMAAVVAIAITITLNTPAYAARRYFSKAIIAANDVKSMIMKLKVRTDADEPIDYINPECDFACATIKVIYDEPMLWSIEKENGRSLLYKGAEDKGDYVYQWINKGNESIGWLHNPTGYVDGDLAILLDPSLLLDAERKAAEYRKGSKYEIIDNGISVNVKVTTMAQGNYAESNYMLNSSLAEANTIREYTFDKASGHLTKLRIDMVISSELQVTVIDSDNITYDAPLSAAELTTQDINNITFSKTSISADKSSPLVGISAGKAAKIILQAMNEWDENILNTAMLYYRELMPKLKSIYGGMKVVSIDKPFKSGLYPGRFVRSKVILADGTEKELVIAIRNDNEDKVWLLDGGL